MHTDRRSGPHSRVGYILPSGYTLPNPGYTQTPWVYPTSSRVYPTPLWELQSYTPYPQKRSGIKDTLPPWKDLIPGMPYPLERT